MLGEELARCHVGAMLRGQPGRYYCARCLARLVEAVAWTKRDIRRAISVLFRWPIGLTIAMRRRRQPCRGCGQIGGARLGAVAMAGGS
jgi:hypothetical protein